jgi:hypothetical protein
MVTFDEPETYQQAISSEDPELWEIAITEELNALKRNHTWDVVTRPKDANVVKSKWVFKYKFTPDGTIKSHKAHLVAKGFSQIPGTDYDKTYAPVARYDSHRLLIALAAHHGWNLRQLDVKSAFLYGTLDRDIYMELPNGSREPSKVCKLRKCIYGLKQSPLVWYSTLANILITHGFTPTKFDPCVSVRSEKFTYLSVHVDDIMLFGNDPEIISNIENVLHADFECTDLCTAAYVLGIEIKYSLQDISLNQHSFINKILE